MVTRLAQVGLGPALREAEREAEGEATEHREHAEQAIGRALALAEPESEEPDPEEARRAREEAERQVREDAIAADAMEMIDRARRRNGRIKWSSTEGAVQRRLVDALRSLPVGEVP